MAVPNDEIGGRYEEFYLNKRPLRVYPTEFVVRIFLSKYPEMHEQSFAFSGAHKSGKKRAALE